MIVQLMLLMMISNNLMGLLVGLSIKKRRVKTLRPRFPLTGLIWPKMIIIPNLFHQLFVEIVQ